tara:strand:+ start:16900 stop:17775 length:876 start_codon:yes stop_codon:yes gene_type:complete
MKKSKLISIFIFLGILLSYGEAKEAVGEFKLSFSAGTEAALKLKNSEGDVVIKGADIDEIYVVGKVFMKNKAMQKDANRIADEIVNNPPVIQEGNLVDIALIDKKDSKKVYIDYKIRVPFNTTIEAANGSGDISITNITTALDITVGSGDVEIESVEGEMKIDAGSGDVSVNFSEGGDCDISTGSGSIEVENANSGLSCTAGSGDVGISGVINHPWTIKTGSGEVSVKVFEEIGFDIDIKTGSGDINLSGFTVTLNPNEMKEDKLEAIVGNGGELLKIRTGSGDVTVKKSE